MQNSTSLSVSVTLVTFFVTNYPWRMIHTWRDSWSQLIFLSLPDGGSVLVVGGKCWWTTFAWNYDVNAFAVVCIHIDLSWVVSPFVCSAVYLESGTCWNLIKAQLTRIHDYSCWVFLFVLVLVLFCPPIKFCCCCRICYKHFKSKDACVSY